MFFKLIDTWNQTCFVYGNSCFNLEYLKTIVSMHYHNGWISTSPQIEDKQPKNEEYGKHWQTQ